MPAPGTVTPMASTVTPMASTVTPMAGTVTPVPDVARAFAELVIEAVARHPADSGRPFLLVLSGGSTARRCYEALATQAGAVDWRRVVVTLGDERCVAADDPDANQLLVRQSLLDPVGAVGGFVPLPCGSGIAGYERWLRRGIRPDVVHLGLGPDGHCASLFPGSPALHAGPDRLVVENVDPSGRNPHRRATWTFAAIARARQVVFTVAGTEKAAAWQAVTRGAGVPAAKVRAERVQWLVDPQAAPPTSSPTAP